MFGKIERIIWIIPDIVSNRIIEFYGLFNGIFTGMTDRIIRIFDNGFMITVNDCRGAKIFFVYMIH